MNRALPNQLGKVVEAIDEWCERISEATGTAWRYVHVDQTDFDTGKPAAIADLASTQL